MIKPKLALIPSSYKGGSPKGTLYSVLPSNGVGDFDFERAGEATRINKDGLIETVDSNVPRLNYPLIDGVVSGCPSLLLEPSRSNLIERSEEFTNSYWSTSRIETPYIADVVSPDGTLNAYTLEMSSGETNGGGVFNSGISISGDNSFSVFAKKKTANYLVLADTGTINNAVYFDLENGVVGTTYNATGEMEYFGNGWYRCTMKYSLTSNLAKFIYLSNIDGATNGGVVGGDSIYIWGAQLEQGSYATSYIPTQGSIGTRVAESCEQTPPSGIIGQTEGTIYVEYPNIDNSFAFIGLSVDGGNSNRMIIYSIGDNILNAQFRQAGDITLSGISSVINGKVKAALSFSSTESVFYVNGIQVAVGTATIWSGLNQVNLNQSNQIGAKVKDLRVYNTRLSNAELQALTQI